MLKSVYQILFGLGHSCFGTRDITALNLNPDVFYKIRLKTKQTCNRKLTKPEE